MSDQTPQQRPLGGDPDVPQPGNPQLPQSALPSGRVHERLLIDLEVGVRSPQDLQEVEPALALGAGEEGEQLVTDVGADTIVPLVPRPGVVHLSVGRDRQGRRQEFGLLLVKDVLSLGEDPAEFAGLLTAACADLTGSG